MKIFIYIVLIIILIILVFIYSHYKINISEKYKIYNVTNYYKKATDVYINYTNNSIYDINQECLMSIISNENILFSEYIHTNIHDYIIVNNMTSDELLQKRSFEDDLEAILYSEALYNKANDKDVKNIARIRLARYLFNIHDYIVAKTYLEEIEDDHSNKKRENITLQKYDWLETIAGSEMDYKKQLYYSLKIIDMPLKYDQSISIKASSKGTAAYAYIRLGEYEKAKDCLLDIINTYDPNEELLSHKLSAQKKLDQFQEIVKREKRIHKINVEENKRYYEFYLKYGDSYTKHLSEITNDDSDIGKVRAINKVKSSVNYFENN